MSSNTLSSIPIFAPTQISGCQLWLDGADSSSMSFSGSTITTWRDKSGNGNNATATGTPTLGNTINGVQSVVAGSGNYFNGAVTISTTTLTCFAVALTTASQPRSVSDQRLVSLANTTNVDYGRTDSVIALFNQALTSTIATWRVTGPLANNTIVQNVAFMAVSQYDGTNAYLWFNGSAGSLASSASSGSFAITKYGIGNQANPQVEYWLGSIGEVILFNTSLTTAQRQQIEGYLAWKWGLVSSLPASNPYKNIPVYGNSTLPPQFRNIGAIPLAPSSSPFSFFNPASVPNCSLWLDAADTTTITSSGGAISQWRDKSSSGLVLAQATASNQPTLGPLLNNLQTIQFAIPQNMRSTGNLLTNPAQTWFTVFNAYNNTNNNRFFLNHSSNIGVTGGEYFFGGNGVLWNNIKSGNLSAGRAIIDDVGLGVTPFNSGQWYNTNIVDSNTTTDTTSYSFRINGTNRAISIYAGQNSIISGTANISVAINEINANTYFAEVIFYNTALTMSQVQQVEGYLAWKWGLQNNLPSNHPYKNAPPGLPVPSVPPRLTMNTRIFTPLSFSSCLLWLDAADTSTITPASGTVTGWTNKGTISVSANNTGSGAAGTVTSGSITQNGNNVIRFPAGAGLSITFASPNQPRAWFIVARNTTQMSASVLYWATVNQRQGAGQDNPFGPGAYSSGGNTYTMTSGPSGIFSCITTTTAPEPYNVMKLYTWQVSAATTALNTINVNGSPMVLSKSILAQSYRTDSVAYSINTPSYNTGADICEIVFYNTEMTVAQRQQVEGYLAWKWGLQGSLPANHPYKRFPPAPN